MKQSVKSLLDSGLLDYFGIPYEVVKLPAAPIYLDDEQDRPGEWCTWNGGVLGITKVCDPVQLIHEASHFLVAIERFRFGNRDFYLLSNTRPPAAIVREEIETSLLGYVIAKQLGFRHSSFLEYFEDLLPSVVYDFLNISSEDYRIMKRAFDRLKRRGLLDTPYTDKVAPLLEQQIKAVSKRKLKDFDYSPGAP